MQIPAIALTHAGAFHADDVFSAALLRMLRPDIEIIRRNFVPDDFDGLVFDIGRGKFDHHMTPIPTRPNGKVLAAFGLLWAEFRREILPDEKSWAEIDAFAARLDEADNYGTLNDISASVAAMNPNWDEDITHDEAFEQAIAWASIVLTRRIESCKAKTRASEKLAELKAAQEPPVLELDRYMPFFDATVGTDYLYVIYPSVRGTINAQAVPKNLHSRELVKPFPAEWCGKDAEELAAITGIEGFSFCHATGFLCAADTLEQIRSVVDLALKA